MRLLPAAFHDLEPRARRAMLWSAGDGILAAVTDGLALPALSLYAVALGMPILAIGLIGSLPYLAGSVSQRFAHLLERACGSRKRTVVLGCGIHALSWLAVPVLGRLPAGPARDLLVLTAACLGTAGQFIIVPSWSSWFGDLIPPPHRVGILAWRSMLSSAATGASILGMGLWMRAAERRSVEASLGSFAAVFAAAALCRLLSAACLACQHEPPAGSAEPGGGPGAPADRRGLAAAALFFSAFHFALFLSAPYFSPYMRLVGLDYLQIAGLLAVSWPARMLFLPAWQRAAQRYGKRRVILASGGMTALLPWLWALSPDWRYLMAVQVLNGMAWGGIELCELPYLLELTSPGERTRQLASYFSLRSLSGCLGAVGGDLAMKTLPARGSLPYLGVFLLSGAGRVAAVLGFRRRLSEDRAAGVEAAFPRVVADILRMR